MVLLRERTWEGRAWWRAARWCSNGWRALAGGVVSLACGWAGAKLASDGTLGAFIGGVVGIGFWWTVGAVVAVVGQRDEAKAHLAWLETDDVAIRRLGELLARGVEMVNAASGHVIPKDMLGDATGWAHTVHAEIEGHFGRLTADKFMLYIDADSGSEEGVLGDVDKLKAKLAVLPDFAYFPAEERAIIQAWTRDRLDWLRVFVNARRESAGQKPD